MKEYKLVTKKSIVSDSEPKIKLINASETKEFLLNTVFDKDTIDVFESAYVVFLNRNLEVKGYMQVSSGGVACCIIDPKIVFAAALKCLASCIVISHNHPSGNTTPSKEDKELTKKLVQGGDILQIKVIDHIIISSDGNFYSFAEWGNL
jgi:DNA repair protein RadC